MKTLNLSDINYINSDNFTIVKNNNRFILKYNNENFVIDSETCFEKCNIYSRDDHKIKININNSNTHKNFINVMKTLYNIISELIISIDEIEATNIKNPIYSRESQNMLFVTFNSKTQIRNIKTNEIINTSDLYDKVFDIYPIFYSPNINVSGDNIYINFTFYTIFIDSLETNIQEVNEVTLDYDKIKKIMNKK
jgi:hypothetical protein